MDQIEECGMTEMPGDMPPAPIDQGSPVTMNVNLSASGKQHVEDLVKMMQHAGMGDAEPVSSKTLAPRLDFERLRGIVDGPETDEPKLKLPAPEEAEEADEGYENAPDAKIGDMQDAIPDGDDLHRSKDRKAIRTNDPALENIKADLYAALSEKKGKPDFLDLDKDGDKDEPMSKAAKDAGKGKGSKPKKGEVPPQFKK